MEDKRLDAAQQLLDGGVRFLLPAPFFLRWLRVRITLRAHRAGTILCFSEIVLKYNLEEIIAADKEQEIKKCIKPIVECIAISALNGYWKIKFFRKILSKYLLWQLGNKTLSEIFLMTLQLNQSKDFTTITKWYIHQMQQMMNPNLGQMQGS